MAKHKAGNANQKMYFAKFYLDLIAQTQKDDSVLNKKALIIAHQQSCLYHLYGAYLAFIWEVANTYDEPFGYYDSLAQLIENSSKKGKDLSELTALRALECAPESWLAKMLNQWQRVNTLDPLASGARREQVNLNAIEVHVVSETEDMAQLSDWYEKLLQAMDRTRELLVEW